LRVVEPANQKILKKYIAGSTTRNVKILRKYIAGSTTRNAILKKNLHCRFYNPHCNFEKKITLRVVEPAMCFEFIYFLFICSFNLTLIVYFI